MSIDDRPVAPVEIIVIGFPTPTPGGGIGTVVADLVDQGTVRVLDTILVSKDLDGTVTVLEVEELEDAESDLAELTEELAGLIAEEDALAVAESLPEGTCAVVVAWENVWARPVVAAVADNGGFLIAHERIGADELAEVLDAIDEDEE